jgi:hypothetical protein
MWCSLYFSIKQWQKSNQEKEWLLRAESEVREAKLLALRYQLNPHFLFNSLNAVSTLILDGNAPAATRMLAQIGDLLRIKPGFRSHNRGGARSGTGLYRRVLWPSSKHGSVERLRIDITVPIGNAGCPRAKHVAAAAR